MYRTRTVLAAIALAAAVSTLIPAPASAAPTQGDAAASIMAETNVQRARNGSLPPLIRHAGLDLVAQQWAETMAREGVMRHNPDRKSQMAPGWSRAGENVAQGYTADVVVARWMESDGHRQNILDPQFTHIGVGYVETATGGGWSVQVFATYRQTFKDVASTTSFHTEIDWLASNRISTGWIVARNAVEFRPGADVQRDAMAAFLYRLSGSPEFTPPARSPFTDVDRSHPFYREITWLASRGISTGWQSADGTSEFRPSAPIARDAMAAFLYRLAGAPRVPSTTASAFTDVPTSRQFFTEISWLSRQGISTGWLEADGSRTFRPSESIARDAMAAFMYRYDMR